jgi:hypothetical protein
MEPATIMLADGHSTCRGYTRAFWRAASRNHSALRLALQGVEVDTDESEAVAVAVDPFEVVLALQS